MTPLAGAAGELAAAASVAGAQPAAGCRNRLLWFAGVLVTAATAIMAAPRLAGTRDRQEVRSRT